MDIEIFLINCILLFRGANSGLYLCIISVVQLLRGTS